MSFEPVADIQKRVYDASCLKDFLSCKRKFFYNYIQKLTSKDKSIHLQYGSAIHEALACWYRGAGEEAALEAFKKEMVGSALHDLKNVAGGIRMLEAYFKKYQKPEAEPFKIIEKDGKRLVEVNFSVKHKDGFTMAGRIDMPVEWDGQILVCEHKTTGQLGANFFGTFILNLQIDVYCWALSRLLGKCNGAVVNALQLLKTKEVCERDISSRSQKQNEQIDDYLLDVVEDLESRLAGPYPDGTIDLEETKKLMYMQRGNACSEYGGCQYKTMCLFGQDDRLMAQGGEVK